MVVDARGSVLDFCNINLFTFILKYFLRPPGPGHAERVSMRGDSHTMGTGMDAELANAEAKSHSS